MNFRWKNLCLALFVLLFTTGCRKEVADIYYRFSTGTVWIDAAILVGITAGLSLIAYSLSGTLAVMIVCCVLVYYTIDIGGALAAIIVVMTGAGTIALMQDLVKKAKEVEKAREEMREEHRAYEQRERERHGGDRVIPRD